MSKLDFTFTDQHFHTLSQLVTKETGIELPPHKKSLMYTRLARRLRSLNYDSFDDYILAVKKELMGAERTEMQALVNAMTTNVTSFFREAHHMEHLQQHAFKELQEKHGSVKLWSAACSTGEEPYSIAMTALEYAKKAPLKLSILASDLDTQAVQQAQRGVYTLDADALGKFPLLKNYTQDVGEARQVVLAAQAMIKFKNVNLMHDNWGVSGPLHIVFCRNCVIYFSKDTQRKLFSKIADLMPQGSYLYLGHSESLINVSDAYKLVGRTIYQKL